MKQFSKQHSSFTHLGIAVCQHLATLSSFLFSSIKIHFPESTIKKNCIECESFLKFVLKSLARLFLKHFLFYFFCFSFFDERFVEGKENKKKMNEDLWQKTVELEHEFSSVIDTVLNERFMCFKTL